MKRQTIYKNIAAIGLGVLVSVFVFTATVSAQIPSNPYTGISAPSSQSGIYVGQQQMVTQSGVYTTAVSTTSSTMNGAKCSTNIKKFADVFNLASCVINSFLITIAVTFATIYFIWGVVQYVLSPDSVEERKKSKQVMLWGILSLFVIVSVWGIVAAVRSLFGI